MLKNMVSPKLLSNTKQTGNTLTAGNAALTVLSSLFANVLEDLTTVLTSTLPMKSNLSWTCADAILMPGWSCFGLSLCSGVIPVLSLVYTASSVSTA